MGWCDDPLSKDYNKLIKYPFSYKSENLYKTNNIYDIILVLNFNMQPIKKTKEVLFSFTLQKVILNRQKGVLQLKELS